MIDNNKIKVLVNQIEHVDLNQYDLNDNDNDNLNYNIINKNRPIGYHNFCFDPQNYQYKSINKKDNNTTHSFRDNPYLYSRNLKFVHERYNEMCYICSSEPGPSILMWSWEFGRQIEINEFIMNLIFMIFEEEGFEINWYISTNLSNEIKGQFNVEENNNVIQLVRDQFTKIPLNLVPPVYFDKKINLTNLIQGANKVFLACIMDNNGEELYRSQLFRSKFVYNAQEDIEPLHPPQKNEFPFEVSISLSLKNDLLAPSFQINKDSNYFIREELQATYDQNIKKNQAIKWNNERVQDWLFDLGFYELVPKFKLQNIDGKKLLGNGINGLPNNFLQDLKKRKRYVKALNLLLQNSNMSMISLGLNGSCGDCLPVERPKYSHQYKEDTMLILDSDTRAEQEYVNDIQSASVMTLELDDKENSNYKIVVDDKEFLIHKELLTNTSDYFHAIFNSTFNESLNNESIFKEEPGGLTKDSLQMVLELTYLHYDDMKIEYLKQLEWDQIITILKVSDRLFFNSLKYIIEKYVIWNINSKNLNSLHQLFKFNNSINLFSSFLTKFYNN